MAYPHNTLPTELTNCARLALRGPFQRHPQALAIAPRRANGFTPNKIRLEIQSRAIIVEDYAGLEPATTKLTAWSSTD